MPKRLTKKENQERSLLHGQVKLRWRNKYGEHSEIVNGNILPDILANFAQNEDNEVISYTKE